MGRRIHQKALAKSKYGADMMRGGVTGISRKGRLRNNSGKKGQNFGRRARTRSQSIKKGKGFKERENQTHTSTEGQDEKPGL